MKSEVLPFINESVTANEHCEGGLGVYHLSYDASLDYTSDQQLYPHTTREPT